MLLELLETTPPGGSRSRQYARSTSGRLWRRDFDRRWTPIMRVDEFACPVCARGSGARSLGWCPTCRNVGLVGPGGWIPDLAPSDGLDMLAEPAEPARAVAPAPELAAVLVDQQAAGRSLDLIGPERSEGPSLAPSAHHGDVARDATCGHAGHTPANGAEIALDVAAAAGPARGANEPASSGEAA